MVHGCYRTVLTTDNQAGSGAIAVNKSSENANNLSGIATEILENAVYIRLQQKSGGEALWTLLTGLFWWGFPR
jgi:hypothetical protein